MSRTLGALAAHVAASTTSLARCIRLDLVDGTALGIADHDLPLAVDLGDGVLVYSASTGVLPSDVVLSVGFESDSLEVRGPLDAVVTRAAVLGGRYGRAAVRLFDVNWRAPAGFYPLMSGDVAEARVDGGEFVFEIRGLQDRFNQTIGRVLSPFCSARKASCCVNIAAEVETSVTAVTDDATFTVAAAIAPADFVGGRVTFTSGALAGTRPMEIAAAAGSELMMFAPLAAPPQVGDLITLKEGCDRTRATCRDRFDNVVNFDGFPDLTGNDQFLRLPIPGAGGTAV